jgi:hypothetical protein
MAQRVTVQLVCDLHDNDTAGEETVTFGLDGASYEIDLCATHARTLREAFAPFVGPARRVTGGRGRRAGRGRSGAGRDGSAEIRAWARGQGIEVSERGRIPASLAEQYAASRRR